MCSAHVHLGPELRPAHLGIGFPGFSPQFRTSGEGPGFSALRRLSFAADLLPRTHWNVNLSYYHDHTFEASTSTLLCPAASVLVTGAGPSTRASSH